MERYNFKVVEQKWQKLWDKNNCKTVQDNTTLGQEIKLAILKKATIIKSSEISENQKNYSSTGSGRSKQPNW